LPLTNYYQPTFWFSGSYKIENSRLRLKTKAKQQAAIYHRSLLFRFIFQSI